MTAKNYAFALAIGAVFGAGIALLFAPQSGAETRKDLQRGAEDAGDYFDDVVANLKTQAEDLSAQAEKLSLQAKEKISQANDIVSGAVKSRLV